MKGYLLFMKSRKKSHAQRYGSLILSLVVGIVLLNASIAYARKSRGIGEEFFSLRRECLHTLRTPSLLRIRKNVEKLTRRCNRFQKRYPVSNYATRALYLEGLLWEGLYKHTHYISDWNHALKAYSHVIAFYPNSWLADDALFRRGILYLKLDLKRLALNEFRKLTQRYPNSDLYNVTLAHIKRIQRTKSWKYKKKKKQENVKTEICPSFVTFHGFRYWANERYARVVMDFSSKVPFHFHTLDKGRRTELILILDEPFALRCSKRGIYGKHREFMRFARLVGRNRRSSKIIISFSSKAQCKVFTLFSPFRIVVDAVLASNLKHSIPRHSPPFKKRKDFVICLDPGHGGKDPGATGPHGVKEKDVVLRIARILKKKLVKRYGYRVIMTRSKDVFIPLEQRVAFANSQGADLFVSIHINASRNRRLQGISTFCLSNTSDQKVLRLAARENGVPVSKMSSVDKILNDMLFSEKYNESYKVAHLIHQTLISKVRSYNPHIQNLGVRFAPFYVLAGAKMPSILLELDFISNPYGEKRLVQYRYLNRISEGIAQGIARTTRSVNIARNYFN